MYSTSSGDVVLIPKIVAKESGSQWAKRTLFHNSPSHIQLFENWEYKRNAFTNIMCLQGENQGRGCSEF
jgi:hypothetical protein